MTNGTRNDNHPSTSHQDRSLRLHPDHIQDLRKSGLSDEMIQEAKIYSVPPKDINKKLGFNDLKIESVLCFPYPGCDGFERYKPFPSLDGKPKYLQKKGTGNHLYIPERVRPVLSDPIVPLCITEGEKKTLKAVQEGLNCIGLGGLWNWSDGSEEKNLIPDFGEINFEKRSVLLVPDNDWKQPDRHGEQKNLWEAVHELTYRLIDRGAKVYVVELPDSPLKGLDDYLCQRTIDEFKTLPKREVRKQTLDELVEGASLDNLREVLKRLGKSKETEKEVYVERLSKKLKIPKRAIKEDLKGMAPQKASGQESLATAYFPKLVDLCVDEEGKIGFLIHDGDTIALVSSYEVESQILTPPEKKHLPFALPRGKEVLRWAGKEGDHKLFEDLETHLRRFSFLPDHQWTAVTLFAFLTYIQDHPDIRYFPMLLFWASSERGKSRTGKALSYVCYRGIHLVDMREANLFRYSANLRSVLFFDMMNLWKKAEQKGAEDILLLRYEKGAKTSRVLYPEKGPFKDTVYYDVYGPTIMATNEPVHHILDTRCLTISMPNKPGDYENPTAEQAQELKERLTAWRARVMDEALPEIERMQGLNGRLWDISKSLFQICKMVCPERFVTLKGAILEIAGQRVEEKQDTIEGQIVSVINKLSPEGLPDWKIQVQDVLDELNKKRSEDHKLTSQYLGRRIKALGFKTRRVHGRTEILLSRPAFQTFLAQFGLCENFDEPLEETLPNATYLQNQIDSSGYSGRELVEFDGECQETLPITLPDKCQANQEVMSLVESGRVSTGDVDAEKEQEIDLKEGMI